MYLSRMKIIGKGCFTAKQGKPKPRTTSLFYYKEPKVSEVSIPQAGMFVEGAEPLSPFNEHSLYGGSEAPVTFILCSKTVCCLVPVPSSSEMTLLGGG
jgi:hypothetical protein